MNVKIELKITEVSTDSTPPRQFEMGVLLSHEDGIKVEQVRDELRDYLSGWATGWLRDPETKLSFSINDEL